MTSATYSMVDDMEREMKEIHQKEAGFYNEMFTQNTHKKEKIYKSPKNKMPALKRQAEEDIVKEIEDAGGTVISLKTEDLTPRRYKRRLAKQLRKQSKSLR